VLELLEEHVGGAIPRDPDALGYADGEALAHDTGSSADVRFPRPGSGATTRGDTTAARPRVGLPPDHELSLDEGTAASAEVRLPSPAAEPDADLDAPLDLDAIALSSLEGGPQPSEDPLAGAGTAVVERPPPLPPSQHEDGDV